LRGEKKSHGGENKTAPAKKKEDPVQKGKMFRKTKRNA